MLTLRVKKKYCVVHILGGSGLKPDLMFIALQNKVFAHDFLGSGHWLLFKLQLRAVAISYSVIQQYWITYNLLNAISHLNFAHVFISAQNTFHPFLLY